MLYTVVLAAVVLTGILAGYIFARPEIRAAYQRLGQLERQTADTRCGQLEYAVRGDGAPVLMAHGNAGGFDQGMDWSDEFIESQFMVISPSRFGYLGTPLPDEATPEMQADAFVCLLDELGIERTAVIAVSAGGPSAVQMALRYPERVSALVLVSTAIADKETALPPKAVYRSLAGSDFIFWLLTRPFRAMAQGIFISGGYRLTPDEDTVLAGIMGRILPVKPRQEGMFFDMYVTNTDGHRNSSAYRLEEIPVPVLVLNARDDPAANYEDARTMSERFPRATLVTIEEGGHMMLRSGDFIRSIVNEFLREYALRE